MVIFRNSLNVRICPVLLWIIVAHFWPIMIYNAFCGAYVILKMPVPFGSFIYDDLCSIYPILQYS